MPSHVANLCTWAVAVETTAGTALRLPTIVLLWLAAFVVDIE